MDLVLLLLAPTQLQHTGESLLHSFKSILSNKPFLFSLSLAVRVPVSLEGVVIIGLGTFSPFPLSIILTRGLISLAAG